MGQLLDAGLTDDERRAAEEIVRLLCDDIVDSVRKALAHAVASSPNLPPRVARRLALDIEEVSLPILEVSHVLSDDVLMEVIGKATPRQLEATARRPDVSEDVSDAIVERGHVPAVSMLVANMGAQVGSETWLKVIERHGEDESVARAAGLRGGIPDSVAASLTKLAKAHVSAFVTRYLNVPPSTIPAVDDLKIEVQAGRNVTPVVPDGEEPGQYAAMLHEEQRLDYRLLFQALCAGEFTFLTAAVARLTELSFVDVQRRLFTGAPDVRRNLLERAGVDPKMTSVFESLLGMGFVTDQSEYQKVALETVSAAAGRDVTITEAA